MNKKRLSKKAIILICVLSVLILALGVGAFFFFGMNGSSEEVYVSSVKDIIKEGSLGLLNRYSGIVETEELNYVEFDSSKTLSECFVSEGDTVEVGTPLFAYDITSSELAYEQLKLEYEEIENNIATQKDQLKELEKQQKKASKKEQLSYTIQIQTTELSIRREEFNLEKKLLEVTKAEKAAKENVVKSEWAGTIKAINEAALTGNQGGGMEMGYMNPSEMGAEAVNAYITIMGSQDIRIKGLISEQSVYLLTPGMEMTVRSRTHKDMLWQGTLSRVDTENPDKNNNSPYMGITEGTETATKYPFYISLENREGLMIGQHVYIEPGTAASAKEGLWLPEYYIVNFSGAVGAVNQQDAYVYMKNQLGRIAKSKLALGEYDVENASWQILSGVTENDFIAYPTGIELEGAKAIISDAPIKNEQPVLDAAEPAMPDDIPLDAENDIAKPLDDITEIAEKDGDSQSNDSDEEYFEGSDDLEDYEDFEDDYSEGSDYEDFSGGSDETDDYDMEDGSYSDESDYEEE